MPSVMVFFNLYDIIDSLPSFHQFCRRSPQGYLRLMAG